MPRVLDGLEAFLATTLGKGVIRAKDTPNFIANRIGVFSILATMHHTAAVRPGLRRRRRADRPRDRPRRRARPIAPPTWSASTRWRTSSRRWPTRCPTIRGTSTSQPPEWLAALIAKGALGQKTGAGIFRKVGKDILVLDPGGAGLPRRATGEADAGSRRDPQDQGSRREIRQAARQRASAGAVPVGDVPRPLPLQRLSPGRHRRHRARRRSRDPLGLRLALGPFETWQAAGWKQVAQWIADDIAAGKAMSERAAADVGVRRPRRRARRRRQLQPAPRTRKRAALVAARSTSASCSPIRCSARSSRPGDTVFETDGVRMWHRRRRHRASSSSRPR